MLDGASRPDEGALPLTVGPVLESVLSGGTRSRTIRSLQVYTS